MSVTVIPNIVGALGMVSKAWKRIWGSVDQKKNRDHLNFSSAKVSLGDQRRLVVTQSSFKNHVKTGVKNSLGATACVCVCVCVCVKI